MNEDETQNGPNYELPLTDNIAVDSQINFAIDAGGQNI